METLPSFFVRYFSQPFVVWSFGPDSNQRQCLKGNIYLLFLFNSFKYFISRTIIMFRLCNKKRVQNWCKRRNKKQKNLTGAWLLTLFWWFRTDFAEKNDWRKQKWSKKNVFLSFSGGRLIQKNKSWLAVINIEMIFNFKLEFFSKILKKPKVCISHLLSVICIQMIQNSLPQANSHIPQLRRSK